MGKEMHFAPNISDCRLYRQKSVPRIILKVAVYMVSLLSGT